MAFLVWGTVSVKLCVCVCVYTYFENASQEGHGVMPCGNDVMHGAGSSAFPRRNSAENDMPHYIIKITMRRINEYNLCTLSTSYPCKLGSRRLCMCLPGVCAYLAAGMAARASLQTL